MDVNPPLNEKQNESAPVAWSEPPTDPLAEFFTYHAPSPDDLCRYRKINDAALNLARVIHEECPPGPDRTAAVRQVREARMTANAAIACRGATYR